MPVGSLLLVSTVNVDHPQQQWTRQLLCGNTLLPRPLLSSQRCLLLVDTPTQSGSRSPCWNGCVRTKSACTEPLIIFNPSQVCVIVKEELHLAYKPPSPPCTLY